jgi:hypothetical protein
MGALFSEIVRVAAALWKIGNYWLRLVLGTIILWPIAIILAATALPEQRATTIVPLVALLPLAALLLFAMNAPLAIAAVGVLPKGREILYLIAGMIGAELTVGVYVSLVPVSNDRGLLPLLILSALAYAFLRLAKVRNFITGLLFLLILCLTVIFLLGGRNNVANVAQKVEKNVAKSIGETRVVPIAAYDPHKICDDAWKNELRFDDNVDHFDVDLHEGCFSGLIHIPERFRRQYWFQPVNADPQWWFAIWFIGGNPQGPFGANDKPLFNSAPMEFRLQGKGRIRYYTNEPPIASAGHHNTDPSPDAVDGALPQPKPFRPDWDHGSQVAIGDFTILAPACIIAGTNLHCFFRITNQTDHDLRIDLNGYAGPIRVVDDQGSEYRTQTVQLGAEKGNEIQPTLPSGAPVLGSAIFQNFTGHSIALLEISVYSWESNAKLNAHFRQLSVERQENR